MTIQANSSGVVSGKFTVPANIPAGSKKVRFEGSGGSHGEAIFTGTGTVIDETRRLVTTVTGIYYDPLAQTFSLTDNAQIASVDLWFDAVGASKVVVQIRETSNGVPNQTIVGQAILLPANINTTTHTRFAFDAPVNLLANTEYAIVVLCDDATSAVWQAELGKWDNTNQKWVTSQPYQIGVMLSSSNASTWTPHQDRDLAFRINKAIFSQTNRTVSLGSVAVTAATDFIVLAVEEIPSSVTKIEYTLTLPDSSTLVVANGQPVRLSAAVTGNIAISAKLYGDANTSPILFPGTQFVVGHVETSATYISRAIPAGTSVKLKAVFEANIPSGAAVAVSYKGAGASWVTVPYVSSVATDNGFMEMTHQITGVTEASVQLKLTLTGTTGARPRVKNLRFMTI